MSKLTILHWHEAFNTCLYLMATLRGALWEITTIPESFSTFRKKIWWMLFSHYPFTQHRCNTLNCPVGVRHHRSFHEIHISALSACFSVHIFIRPALSKSCRGCIHITKRREGQKMQRKHESSHFGNTAALFRKIVCVYVCVYMCKCVSVRVLVAHVCFLYCEW